MRWFGFLGLSFGLHAFQAFLFSGYIFRLPDPIPESGPLPVEIWLLEEGVEAHQTNENRLRTLKKGLSFWEPLPELSDPLIDSFEINSSKGFDKVLNRLTEQKERPHRIGRLLPTNKSPLDSQEQKEASTQSEFPFEIRGRLNKRKVIFAPPLPELSTINRMSSFSQALELEIVVAPMGSVQKVFLKASSGDRKLDRLALDYVKEMVFERDLGESRGTMRWFFD